MTKRYARKLIGPAIELVPMCPMCRGSIYWTLYGARAGQRAAAYCSNNAIATRIMIYSMNMAICKWAGYVVRNKNGAVDVYSSDGSDVPHKIIRYDKPVD